MLGPTLAFPTLGGGYTTIPDSALSKLSYADFKKNHEPGNPEPVHQQMAYSRMKTARLCRPLKASHIAVPGSEVRADTDVDP